MWVVAGGKDKDEIDDIVRKVKGMYSIPKSKKEKVDESNENDEKPENDHDQLQNNTAKPPFPLSPLDDVPSPIADNQTYFDTLSYHHEHQKLQKAPFLPQDRDSL